MERRTSKMIAIIFDDVIPGAPRSGEAGIHDHHREYGFRACAGACHRARIRATRWAHPGMTLWIDMRTHSRDSNRSELCNLVGPLSKQRAQGRPGAGGTRSTVCNG